MRDKKTIANMSRFKHHFFDRFLTEAEKERNDNFPIQKVDIIKSADAIEVVEYI